MIDKDTRIFKSRWSGDVLQADKYDTNFAESLINGEEYIELSPDELLEEIGKSIVAIKGIKEELSMVIGIDNVKDYRNAIYDMSDKMESDLRKLYKQLEEENNMKLIDGSGIILSDEWLDVLAREYNGMKEYLPENYTFYHYVTDERFSLNKRLTN